MTATTSIVDAPAAVKPYARQAMLPAPRQEEPETPAARWLRLYFYAQDLAWAHDPAERHVYWVQSESRGRLRHRVEGQLRTGLYACGCEWGHGDPLRVCKHIAAVAGVDWQATCPCCGALCWVHTWGPQAAVLCPACLFRADCTPGEAEVLTDWRLGCAETEP